MKAFIIDQLLYLVTGIVIMISIPVFCGPVFTFVFEIAAILSWGYLCRRVLLLPFDFISGKVTGIAYFATQCGIESLELNKNVHYFEWKFNLENGQPLRVLVPIVITKKETAKIALPPKDVRLKITYLRYSKILLAYKTD